MLISYKNGQTSVVLRVVLRDSSVTTGAGLTGLTFSSTGLKIATIADNEATATTYSVAGSTIETISTLGAFATPTATKCRFKEVDSTNLPGVYEIQLDNTRFAVSSAKSLIVAISGATNLAQTNVLIPLQTVDPYISGGKLGVTLASTDVTGNVACDLQTIKTQTVTCGAGVTVLASVGTASTSTAQTGDAYARIGAAGAGLTALGDTRLAYLTGDAFARIGAAGAGLTAVKLASDGLDSVTVETGLNARQAMSIIASSASGVLAGASGTSITIAAAGVPTTNRITAVVDSSGNRTTVTLTPPA